jgi:hypothetical protein
MVDEIMQAVPEFAVPLIVPPVVARIPPTNKLRSGYDFKDVDWEEFHRDFSKIQVPRRKRDRIPSIYRGKPVTVQGKTLL